MAFLISRGFGRTLRLLGAVALAAMLASHAQAQSTWQGASSDYNDNGNWTANAPVTTGDSAIFSAAGSTNIVTSLPVSPDSWTFDAASQAYTISGSAVNFSGSGITNNAAGQTITIANDIGGGGVTMNAAGGTMILSGNSGYSGATTITGGTLAGGAADVFSANSDYTVGANAVLDIGGFHQTISRLAGASGTARVRNSGGAAETLQVGITGFTASSSTFAGVIEDNGSPLRLEVHTSGILTLTGDNTYTGGTLICDCSTLQLGSGGASGTVVGDIDNNGLLILSHANVGTYTLAANINQGFGSPGRVTKTDSGLTILTGANQYAGATTVSAGTLRAGAAFAFSYASAFTVASGATLDLAGTDQTIDSLFGAGTVTNSGGVLSNFFLGGFGFGTTASVFGGVIQNGTGGVLVEIEGPGLTVTGANTYTGGTTICDCSSLTIGNGGATGSVVGNITNNNLLTFNRSNTYSFAGDIADGFASGRLVQAGNGTTILTGANTYTGTTTISAGTLQIGSGGTTGTLGGTGAIADNGTLAVNRSNTLTIARVISGTGGVTSMGTGTLILTGNNSFGGTTAINAGSTIALQNNGVVTNSAVANNGTFDITAITPATATIRALSGSGTVNMGGKSLVISSGAGTYAGVITGTGGLSLTGGTTIFSGNSTYTGVTSVANGATLQIGAGGATGSLASPVTNNGTVAFNRSDTLVFPTTITGSGNLTQAGSGTLVVTNSNTFGAVTISAGTLQVGNGGTAGSIGSGAITNNGRLAINHSDAVTLANVISGTGGLTQGGSGNLILTGTNTYTGTTLINSGTLSVNGSIAGSAVTITGGTLGGTGTTGAVTVASGGGIAPGNSIGTINVASLTLASGSTTTIEVSPTAADRINVTGAASLNGALVLVPGAGTYGATTYRLIQAGSLTGTFSSVTGSVTGFTNTVQYSPTAVDLILSSGSGTQTTFLFGAYGNTPNQIAAGNGLAAASPTGALYLAMGGLVGSNVSQVAPALGLLAGDIRPSLRAAAIDDSRLIRNILLDRMDRGGQERAIVWATGFGGYGGIRSDGNAAGLHHDNGGFLAGVDFPLMDKLRLGVFGGYSGNSARTTSNLSTASGDLGHIGGYVSFRADQVNFNIGGDYGFGKVSITRAVSQLGQVNTGSQDQQTGQAFADLGYRVVLDGATLQPHVTLAHITATGGAFTETGGNSALSGAEQGDSMSYAIMGLRATLLDIKLEDYDLIPNLDIGWQHALSRMTPGQTVTYQNASTSFLVRGTPLARDAAAVQAGLDLKMGPATLFIAYDGALASTTDSHGIRGGLDWRF